MASGTDKPRGDGARRRGAVKPQTIDLQAEDVTPAPETTGEDAPETAGASESPEDGAPAAAASPNETEQARSGGDEPAGDSSAGEQASRADDGSGRPPAPSAGNGTRLVTAALAGSAAALVIAGALYLSGLLRPEAAGGLAALRNTVESATARLPALEERLSALESGSGDQEASALQALEDRLAGLEQRLNTAGSSEAPDLSAIESRLDALESRETTAGSDTDLSAVEARLAELESAVGALRENTGDAGDLGQRLGALETRVSDLASAVETLRGRVDSALASRNPESGRALARAAATAVALSGLSRQVDSGRAYEDQLAALRPLVGEDADLDALAAHAGSGLPTVEQLARKFDDASDAILAAGAPDDGSGGIAARLASSARSLVRIRPAGPIAGDSRGARVSRIEAALRAGDLEAARSEWEALDEAARIAAGGWGEALQARLDAEAEIAKLAADTSAALDAPPSGSGE